MRHFEEEMNDLKSRLVDMSVLVQKMIKTTIDELVTRNGELSETILALENEVNISELVIDDKCLKLIALNQPVGADLRFLTSAIRINSDLERMGDEAVNISEMSDDLIKYPPIKPLINIPQMADEVQKMVGNCIRAFNENDAELATAVLKQDDIIDDLKDRIIEDLKGHMIQSLDAQTIQRAIDLIQVARSLERIGDHATNIGEDIIFMLCGKDIRHPRCNIQKTQI
ncbi:MAG: phosphate signaling complex protein PhoU [Endomicrobium sp.]|jgi:phosphate transport system protein|nr:phosphate signaling complex protein PhoU [Endomicrobium sp.]